MLTDHFAAAASPVLRGLPAGQRLGPAPFAPLRPVRVFSPLQGTFASLGANGLYIDQRPPLSRAVWAQAARVETMQAVPRAAEAEADDEATDDEAEAAAEEDELLLGCI